jgi:hypothetical protein
MSFFRWLFNEDLKDLQKKVHKLELNLNHLEFQLDLAKNDAHSAMKRVIELEKPKRKIKEEIIKAD